MAEETLRTIFAKKLNYYLAKAGKNQSDLCKQFGVSSATASDWCNANKMPRGDKIQAIAKWLNISIGDLMEERDDVYYTNEKTAKIAQEIYENKELSLLFDAARDASPEDLKQVYDMLLFLKQKERNK